MRTIDAQIAVVGGAVLRFEPKARDKVGVGQHGNQATTGL